MLKISDPMEKTVKMTFDIRENCAFVFFTMSSYV